MNDKIKLYFKNLNGLRFFAAFMVLICHIELFKKYFNLSNNRETTRFLGFLGVDLFFVLSGFLITFLLLKEKEFFKKISFKNFYIRRILRIWPLYYLIVILSLFILPKFSIFHINGSFFEFQNTSEAFKIILLFIFILPNVLYLMKPIAFSAQTWSIGVEEQFYLIWPFIVNKFKNYKLLFVLIIVFYWFVYWLLHLSFLSKLPYADLFRSFYALFKIDVLSVGALGAVLYDEKNKICDFVNSKIVFLISIVAIIIMYFYLPNEVKVIRMIYAILFMIIILNLILNKKIENLFENKLFNHLGKISYGIYMYHQILIVLVINLVLKNFKNIGVLENCIIYFFSIIFTLLISHVSYVYFETPLLKVKNKFSSFSNEK